MADRALRAAIITALLCGSASTGVAATTPAELSPQTLGALLFADVNLSLPRTQSCATCHDPTRGFADARPNSVAGAVSLGADGRSFGTRNAPGLAYAALTPSFREEADGTFRGGFFHDGRAATLADQAKEPLLNPLEMALPDASALRARVMENPAYVAAFTRLYGAEVLQDEARVHDAVAQALAEFESTSQFAPFDSKFDRYLRGEYELSRLEEIGHDLFFSNLINCSQCHLLGSADRETFTDYSYHNIGVPANPVLASAADSRPDTGLASNLRVRTDVARGKFKVPSLRNVAVTAPYMHNGVFGDLRTVLWFYNRYLLRDARNPATGANWEEPEEPANISTDLLGLGQPLSGMHVAALLAFLNTLTDRRFEPLLPPPAVMIE